MNVEINLPSPHENQRLILSSDAKRKVICAGRRAGKTELVASLKAVPHFLAGGRVLYGAPVISQTEMFWETINRRLYPLIKAGFIYRNKTEKYLEWMTGRDGRIRAKTAYDADTWRGDWGDLLIYDEFAYMNADAWHVVGVPMLLDNDGEAWFISTPNRKNHFHSLYIRGIDDQDSRWQSFQFTSYDNPHLSKIALDEIVFDMTEAMVHQEIEAKFLENEGAVFRNVAEAHIAPPTRPRDHENHFVVAGIDWGKKRDYTAVSIGCRDCMQEIALTRFNKIDYTYQRGRIHDDWEKWSVDYGLGESNSIGEPNLDELQLGGLNVDGFATTAKSKRPLIEGLVRVVEQLEVRFLNSPIAQAEMEAYEVKLSANTQIPTYSAPSGVHDDTVIARALMVKAMTDYLPAFL